MSDKAELDALKENIKKDMRERRKDIPARKLFQNTANICQKLLGKKEPFPWLMGVVVLLLVTPLPSTALAFLLKETEQWNALGWIWVGYMEFGVLVVFVSQITTRYFLIAMRELVVEKIDNRADLEDFQKVISYAWDTPYFGWFTFSFTMFWGVAFSLGNSLYLGQFIGYGLTLGTIIWGIMASSAFYLIAWSLYFTQKLGEYNYHLNIVSPRDSELIFQLSQIYKNVLYFWAGTLAVGTIINSYNKYSVWLVVIITWIPITILFVNSQAELGKIIATAKWKTLNEIQEKIEFYHRENIAAESNIANINRLMDYHDRVQKTRSSIFDLKTGLSFLNQLALPLLGFVFANWEKIFSFLK